MKIKTKIILGFCATFVLITVVQFAKLAVVTGKFDWSKNYVTSTYSKYCYKKGEENPNMKKQNMTYYVDLESCGKTLKVTLKNP